MRVIARTRRLLWVGLALTTLIAGATVFGLSAGASTTRISDAAVAAARARFEDESARRGDKVFLTGVHMDVDTPPAWERARRDDGARVWRAAIESPGAFFLRPYLTGSLPPGASLTEYDADGMAYAAAATATDGAGFWAAAVPGERVVLEVAGSDAPPALTLTRLTHGFADLFGFLDPRAKEGSCHVDANCRDDWAEQKAGVAYYEFEEFGYGALCTGSLLEDTLKTGQPWFLTAHHCISTQGGASSVQLVWNYETTSCGGGLIDASQWKTNFGADYVSGISDAQSDFALLLLRQNPPASATFLKWTRDLLTAGEDVAVIHHPSGSYKRISFGDEVGDDSSYWVVRYNEGSTEGGSSGAPLFNADKEVVGQLFGGYAACNDMNETDAYGKLSVSYTLGFGRYMGPDPDDPPEPGDDDPVDPGDDDTEDTGDSSRTSDTGDSNCCGC